MDGGGSVWIANAADGTVSRIDRDARRARCAIPVGGAPAALAFGGGSLWVADSDSRDVAAGRSGRRTRSCRRFDGRQRAARAGRRRRARCGSRRASTGASADRPRAAAAWTRRSAVGANPTAIAAGAGALWVASEEAGTVTRIDAADRQRRARRSRSATGRARWRSARARCGSSTARTGRWRGSTPSTNAVVVDASASAATRPRVAVGEGAVWVAGGEEGTVARVDPDGPRAVERLETGSSPAAIAVAGGSVWAAADAPPAAHRGGTLRVLVPHAPGADRADRLAALARRTRPGQRRSSSSLAYDGLVAYRRVEGAAGATLVGALATTRAGAERTTAGPTSSRCGAGCATPTAARPARPTSAPRSSASCGHARPPPASSSRRSTRASSARRGACAGGRRCDLVARDRDRRAARTITIHLSRPDADFLHKLTMPVRLRRARRQPARATTGRTPPGTGPYRVAAWDARARRDASSATRYFRSDPARSRRDGLRGPDRGRASRRDRTIEPQIAAVAARRRRRRGPRRPVRQRGLGGHASARSRRSSPGRLHSAPAPTTDWMFLNVRRRPFDDLRVRRAVNFAIDRATASSSSREGREVGQPTCQILPPGFPGYAPVLPVHAAPGGGRGWTAPDLERARRLVAASGARRRARRRPRAGLPERRSAATTRRLLERARLPRRRCGSRPSRTTSTSRTRGRRRASPAGWPTTSRRRRFIEPTSRARRAGAYEPLAALRSASWSA